MPWEGVSVVEIELGPEGVFGLRGGAKIPLGAARKLRNATLEDETWRTMGGADLLGDAISSQINAAMDYFPDTQTQRTLVACADGSLRKDNGNGASWVTLASGLTTTGQVPYWTIGGAESVGRSRKAFFCDRINAPRVLAADAASMAALSNPPADWNGSNQPGWMGVHRDYMWGIGNINDPHRAYRSAQQDHEDFSNVSYHKTIFPGVGERLVAGASYKGFLVLWKYPVGVFAIDTRDDAEGGWQTFQIGKPGAAGPYNILVLENDILWVSPQGTFHLISATDAAGSLRAQDISAAKLGPFFRDQVNLAQLATAQWAYHDQKLNAMLACHGQGVTQKNRRLDVNVARLPEVGPRWILQDRDRNEALFIRKKSEIGIPAMGDQNGQIWELDRSTRTANGSAYVFEWELAEHDLARLLQSVGHRINGRWIALEYDPRNASTHAVEIIRDGVTKQTINFSLSGGPAALPQTLPFVLGESRRKRTSPRVLYGQFEQFGLKGRSSGVNEDVSLMRILIGVEKAA